MNKLLLVIVAFFLSFTSTHAQKRKISKSNKPILAYVSGKYSYKASGIRIVGNIYTLNVRTYKPNVTIDCIWFGNTPVRCDIYNPRTDGRVESMETPGTYIIEANKNLYANFPNIDSSTAFPDFKPPISFRGDCVIFYTHNNRKYHTIVKNVPLVQDKHYRDMQ